MAQNGRLTEGENSTTGYTLNTAVPVTIIAMWLTLYGTLGTLYRQDKWYKPIMPVRSIFLCVHTSHDFDSWSQWLEPRLMATHFVLQLKLHVCFRTQL